MAEKRFHVLATEQHDCFDEQGRQTDYAGSGQDGEFQAGLPMPTPRFRVVGELVHDRRTGLCCPRNAGLGEYLMMWQEALDFVTQLNVGALLGMQTGVCRHGGNCSACFVSSRPGRPCPLDTPL